jgi:hypothetical protein
MVYPALLPLMHTTQLPVVDWTDAPASLNGLVRFAQRRNLISALCAITFQTQSTITVYIRVMRGLWVTESLLSIQFVNKDTKSIANLQESEKRLKVCVI